MKTITVTFQRVFVYFPPVGDGCRLIASAHPALAATSHFTDYSSGLPLQRSQLWIWVSASWLTCWVTRSASGSEPIDYPRLLFSPNED